MKKFLFIYLGLRLVVGGINSAGDMTYSSNRDMGEFLQDGNFSSEVLIGKMKYNQTYVFNNGKYKMSYDHLGMSQQGLSNKSGTYIIDGSQVRGEAGVGTFNWLERKYTEAEGKETDSKEFEFVLNRKNGVLRFTNGVKLKHHPDSRTGAFIGWVGTIFILALGVLVFRFFGIIRTRNTKTKVENVK